jgi:adenylate kinase family enzyme
MRKVAVFGNAGGGKSTLARRLAEITGLPLYVIDLIQFPEGRYRPREKDGGKISHEEYVNLHKEILGRDRWIIDGFDGVALAWERFAAADTLVHVDLPILSHYWGVTKRFIGGQFRNPKGWRCHRRLTPRYRQLVADAASSKRVHHLRSWAKMKTFLEEAERRA